MNTAEKIQDALSELNLSDMNTIIEALAIAHKNAKNEDKALIMITARKINTARNNQIQWLCEEYSPKTCDKCGKESTYTTSKGKWCALHLPEWAKKIKAIN